MRSFSNLWYWIGLAVLWSSVSHRVLGVPHDLIVRAKRDKDGQSMHDLHDITRVNVNRILLISEVSGTWLLLTGSAVLTVLALTAFVYDFEFSQAVILMVFPLAILALMANRTARRIRREETQGEELVRKLLRHRFATQMIGVVAIFVTAMYGMYTNLYVGPFGF